jgi:hypothetical protein
MFIDEEFRWDCRRRLCIKMSNWMNAKLERRDDGKKLTGSKTLSFWPVSTHHEVITLDEILRCLQSGPEFTCVLPAKSLRIKPG